MWVRQERKLWLPLPPLRPGDDGGRHAAHTARLLDRIARCFGRPVAGEPGLACLEVRWLRFAESCAAYAATRTTARICMAEGDPLFAVVPPRGEDGSGVAIAAQAVTSAADGTTWLLLSAAVETSSSSALRPRHLGALGAISAFLGGWAMWQAEPALIATGSALIAAAAGLLFVALGERRRVAAGGSDAEHAFARLEILLLDELDAVADGVISEQLVPDLPFFAFGAADVAG